MPSAVAYIQWENYSGASGSRFFDAEPLTFNSHQSRLHTLQPGDQLWLVSRSPADQQYYFIGVLHIKELKSNAPDSFEAKNYGPFAVVADRAASRDLGTTFPAEGILRALQFETNKPIRHGASIGQSLQTIRSLRATDECILDTVLNRIAHGDNPLIDEPFGLWTKCDGVFARYFLNNWNSRHEPLAFLLYDPPPSLRPHAPVFIHSDKNLRIVARFRESLFLAGHKRTVDPDERVAVREWVWNKYRATTIDPPSKAEFDRFWDAQNGIRSLFLMDDLIEVPRVCPFGEYGRALEWGYPMGVGYRYLSLSQCYLLLACSGLSDELARWPLLQQSMSVPHGESHSTAIGS
jgi:hypothetical protein